MEPKRFDGLSRNLSRARSRRGLLGFLSGAALAIGVGAARPQPAQARCRHATSCDKSHYPPCKDNDNPDCLRVKNVDTGGCACIVSTPECTGHPPCSTGTECTSGLCVFAKGCCTPNGKFCAEPCPV